MVLNKCEFPAPMARHGQTFKQRVAVPVLVALTALITISITDPAAAKRNPQPKRAELAHSSPRPLPLLAVVALSEQRVTIYDANGKILQAPVSTGQKGYETPAGIYSVLEKNREHYSNVYEGASMPFMQRLTWSGIALHAGVLPGRPASHGCIRMPHAFAKELFELTKIGLRVVVVRDDMSPVDITHPALLKPGPIRSVGALAMVHDRVSDDATQLAAHTPDVATGRTHTWRSIASAKATAASAAAKKADEAKQAAVKVESQAAKFARALRLADAARMRAEAQLKLAQRGLEAAVSASVKQRAEASKAKSEERLLVAQEHLDRVKAEGQAKIDAAEAARQEANTAETAKVAAQNEAKLAQAKMAPVSVFISRKTQRLYVRQAFQPVFESSVTIRDPETPIGTTIFAAVDYTNQDADVRWSAISMYAIGANRGSAHVLETRRRVNRDTATATDVDVAKAALDRITIPQEAIDRINESISPGSSLIISDELTSRETGKGTDFVVLMSGEPQGGIIIRRRNPAADYRALRSFRRPYPGASSNPFFWW